MATKKKKPVVQMFEVLDIIYTNGGGIRVVGRVTGHPRVIDGHRALTSPVTKIITENTEYVLPPDSGVVVHVRVN